MKGLGFIKVMVRSKKLGARSKLHTMLLKGVGGSVQEKLSKEAELEIQLADGTFIVGIKASSLPEVSDPLP